MGRERRGKRLHLHFLFARQGLNGRQVTKTSEEAIGRYGTEWIARQNMEMVLQHMLQGFEEPYGRKET